MKRRDFLKTAAAGTLAGLMSGMSAHARAAVRAGRKPNIFFIFADQLRSQDLGCYGGPLATPHLDRLAGDGVRFSHAISTYPVCSPYRAMMLTGLYPMSNGTVTNDTAVINNLPTLAHVCKNWGYATGYIGKWHLEWNRDPFVPLDRRQGFDFWASDNCHHQYFDSFYCGDSPQKTALPGYKPFPQTDLAIQFMQDHREQPFCLFLSYGPPHDPYTAPKEYEDQYPPDRITLRPNVAERATVDWLLKTDPTPLTEATAATRERARRNIDTDDLLKRDIQGYYGATKALDDCLGQLMAALDAAGLREDTILVYTSDHGDMLGSHRMNSKQEPYEESINVPFVLRYPRKVNGGNVTDVLLTPVDILPTLLDLADLPAVRVDGRSLAGACIGAAGETREGVLLMKLLDGGNPWISNGITSWRGVRTPRYTYARLEDRGPWVLFDNEQDPDQLENLIGRPEHKALQERLDALTNQLMIEARDPGDKKIIEAFRQRRREEEVKASPPPAGRARRKTKSAAEPE